MYPVLQYNFSRDIYDPTWKEIMPELLFGIGKWWSSSCIDKEDI